MSLVYVPSVIVPGAKIMAVAEAPGENEEVQRRPLVGAAGHLFDSMLSDAGLSRPDISVANVSRFRPAGNNLDLFITDNKILARKNGLVPLAGKFVEKFIPEHLAQLYREIEESQPNIIMPMGNAALWALTGKKGISSWRASHLEATRIKDGIHVPFLRKDGKPFKVVPTYHPAYIFRAYGDKFVATQDMRRVRRESVFPYINFPEYKFILQPSFATAMDCLAMLLDKCNQGPTWISGDIETKARQTICIGFGWSREEAICIPIWAIDQSRQNSFYDLDEELLLVLKMQELLTHPNYYGIGQNFIYDSQYIARHWGFIPQLNQDTLGSQHVCFPGIEKGLDFLSSLYCEKYHRYWKDDGKEWSGKGDLLQLWEYNAKDNVITWEVAEVLRHVVKQLNREEQHKFQQEVGRCTLRMTLRGVRSNQALRAEFKKELVTAQKDRSEYIEYILGHPINIRSGPQMKALFYNDLKMPVQTDRKTKRPTLNDKALTTLAQKEPLLRPLITAIGEQRSLGVFDSTFVSAKTDGGRIYTSFNPFGPKTFRFSSSKDVFGSGGNMENIPKGTKSKIGKIVEVEGPKTVQELQDRLQLNEAKMWDTLDAERDAGIIVVEGKGQHAKVIFRFRLPNIRKLFLPDPDHIIMDWDLDRADLQVVVWEAEDKELKQALREGVDMHSMNARDLGCDREVAKMWVHGTNYGGSARTMARNCGISVQNSERMRKRWFEAHKGILAWHRRTEASIQHFGYVKNIFGYVIHLFDRPDNLLPEALAWQPQSTVALTINTALVRIERELADKVQLLIQVHDSLVMQAHKSLFPTIEDEIRPRMHVLIPYDDPLIIPSSCKKSEISWGEVE